jgi:dTDP-4-dehydrorhamnose 3,5-epimerase
MIFTETPLKGAFIISPELISDHRGFFTRMFCANEFKKLNLNLNMVQSNLSNSLKKNTIRGMHFQTNGAEESKLIRCIKGSIIDVIIDLRENSNTYCQHFKIELTDTNFKMLYVPEGFAHGFITQTDHTEVFYQVSNYYSPKHEGGVRWNDKIFNIDWGIDNPIISEKDNSHPDYTPKF